MAGPAISFATGLAGAQNAQIWMASVLIGIEPDVRAERRLRARRQSPGWPRSVIGIGPQWFWMAAAIPTVIVPGIPNGGSVRNASPLSGHYA